MAKKQKAQESGKEETVHASHPAPDVLSHFRLLSPPAWRDYELLDSGDGKKLERFGEYVLVRPETQAIWTPSLNEHEWQQADALFERVRDGSENGAWKQHRPLPEQWLLHFDNLAFWARLTPFRHTGIFPEHSAHWQWLRQQLKKVSGQPNVLVLFGYTALTTLMVAETGARVCHVDASRPAIRWAQQNQTVSALTDAPIRWIVDDVPAFVAREIRRGSQYDMIVMDPPVFGRGTKGQIWRLHEALYRLVASCSALLSSQAVGLLVNAYATTFSAVSLSNVLSDVLQSFSGEVAAGELVLKDSASARPISTALYAYWSRHV